MGAAKKGQKRQDEERFSEDHFGVPIFRGERVGDSWRPDENNPFEQTIERLRGQMPDSTRDGAIELHDDLRVCRDIAVSIYGRAWAGNLLGVYDRLRQAIARRKDERSSE